MSFVNFGYGNVVVIAGALPGEQDEREEAFDSFYEALGRVSYATDPQRRKSVRPPTVRQSELFMDLGALHAAIKAEDQQQQQVFTLLTVAKSDYFYQRWGRTLVS